MKLQFLWRTISTSNKNAASPPCNPIPGRGSLTFMSLGIVTLCIWAAMTVCDGGLPTPLTHSPTRSLSLNRSGIADSPASRIPPDTPVIVFKGLSHCHWRDDCPVLHHAFSLKKFVPITLTFAEFQEDPQLPWGKVYPCGACYNLCQT